MSIKSVCLAASALAGAALCATSASAVVIDFSQFTGPSNFGSASAPLVVSTTAGNVIFTGGSILTATTNLPADQTSLYGTASFGTGYTNPITITFAAPINNFFLNLYNGQVATQTYTVADNAGHSTTVSLAPNTSGGASLISFPATGNIVTISSLPLTGSWDFFIDNIGFNEATPGVPEPATWAMMLIGFGATGVALRRRKARAAVTFA